MRKRYAYLVIRKPIDGLLRVLQPSSIINAYSSHAKAEARAELAQQEGLDVFIYQVEIR